MKTCNQLLSIILVTALFAACKKESDPIIVVPPSTGSSLQLNGLISNEAGSGAGNTVFVDLSTDKQTAVARNSWDLGFYSGSDFRVIINSTTSATAKVLTKNDLTVVGATDTVGLNKLALGFDMASWALVDDVSGNLTKTVIPAVSATASDNKVIIINPGTGGAVAAKDWYKIRILRSSNGGYTLQYAKLAATSFATVDITKDETLNFKYVALENGTTVNVEPAKELWDFKWSFLLYQTALGSDMVPYAFSDLIAINTLGGVQAAEVLTSTVSYDNYSAANVASTAFTSTPDAIGAKWRSTSPATGVKTDRFCVVKDSKGNVYKIKFLAMGAGDGGTRGKPQMEYKLVK